MQNENEYKMTKEELIYYIRQFSNMFGVPVRLYENLDCIYLNTAVNLPEDPIKLCFDELIKLDTQIGYYICNDVFYYGTVTHDQYKVIIGPVSEIKPADGELQRIAFLLNIERDDIPLFLSEMKLLCGIHLDTIIQAMILLNFTLNKTMYDISDIRIKGKEQKKLASEIKEKEIFYVPDSNYYLSYARSFSIEKDIIRKIKDGNVEGLIDDATKVPAVSSGHLAPHLLRHQKNFFIRLETISARAALEEGLDTDEIFSLEEYYILKCESLDDIDRIKNLQYHMILDYADRVRKFKKCNSSNSRLVSEVIKYIEAHISESLKTSDIAEHLGKSRGNITTEFKKQTGINLSDFIKLKKVDEAKELLLKTDKDLAQISFFLGFSSQSHFGKVFKGITGMTPTEYRNKN